MLPIQALQRHEKPVNAMALCQDSVFTGSEDMEIKVSGRFVGMYPTPTKGVPGHKVIALAVTCIVTEQFVFLQVFRHFKL